MLGGQNRKRSYVCIPVGYLYNGYGDDVTDFRCHQMDTQFPEVADFLFVVSYIRFVYVAMQVPNP